MALPSSGTISLSQVSGELGYATNDNISMDRLDVRALAQRPTPGSIITMSDFYNGNCLTYDVTVGNGVASIYGYSALGTIGGSIAPSIYRGVTIMSFYQNTAGALVLQFGAIADIQFYGVLVRPGAGVGNKPTLFLPKTAASVFQQGGNTAYTWADGSVPGGASWVGLTGQHVHPQIVFK